MFKKFGPLQLDEEKSSEVAKKVEAAAALAAKDPNFIKAIEDDPEAALSKLGFQGEGLRTFRLHDGVVTRDGCSCSCYPIACGTGVGCETNPGSSSHSH